ncbi:SDR family NAD(P)-dependent oxidoreductase [Enterovibrio sp. ZSDZ35]|uniref:SDR family NAD(P)-dependent oxidoreductase n=1 Tax=Enterovibrio qingdaonensis TaxID=2899818 RepID=A0ABT5QTL0_9GAMM|nr:SDR family NAD(P)-dependent oxidoreductase [Enterovibrio sp. ZSDZ35]MDD1784318.1 SDR family NAD(P)-dependent oxidoreductase [Enterovibrio sp. ZSDZ35]
MNSSKGKLLAVIAGYGEGLGEAIKRTFEDDGYEVVTVSRSGGMILADTTDANDVNRAFAKISALHGTPDVVICNTAILTIEGFLSTTSPRFEETWRTSVMSVFNIAQATIPLMAKQGGGTILVTGATAGLRGGKNFSAFSSAKFALRGLTQSLAREFQPQNIHIAHIVIDGIIWSPVSQGRFPTLLEDKAIKPKDAADVYLFITKQPSSAWTQEIDIRPYNETF